MGVIEKGALSTVTSPCEKRGSRSAVQKQKPTVNKNVKTEGQRKIKTFLYE